MLPALTQFRLRIGGRTMSLKPGAYQVGRMADCWLTLDDDLVSRYHARFLASEGGLYVEDLGSRNGTYVNGRRIEERQTLDHGDQVRIGREIVSVLGPGGDEAHADEEDSLRRTLGPGEETQFPTLIGQLVEKSLKVGKIKEAERYALALTNQLMGARVPVDHPTAISCVRCLVALAERTASGVWLDRAFKLHAVHGWIMNDEVKGRVLVALDRIPRVPGTGLAEYEQALRAMLRDGLPVPPQLVSSIAELADAYGGG